MTGAPLGLAPGRVDLRPYDESWPQLFEQERRLLQAALGDRILAIEHVGSTAIPGIMAKPVLDIATAVEQFEAAFECVPIVEGLGYDYRGEYGIARRHYFIRGVPRTHQVHMVERGSETWRDFIVFRDRLRRDAELAKTYAELKMALAARYPEDRQAYTEAKAEFIREVNRRARQDS